jgi:hypothetical protein
MRVSDHLHIHAAIGVGTGVIAYGLMALIGPNSGISRGIVMGAFWFGMFYMYMMIAANFYLRSDQPKGVSEGESVPFSSWFGPRVRKPEQPEPEGAPIEPQGDED